MRQPVTAFDKWWRRNKGLGASCKFVAREAWEAAIVHAEELVLAARYAESSKAKQEQANENPPFRDIQRS